MLLKMNNLQEPPDIMSSCVIDEVLQQLPLLEGITWI
jgi:hypothetical protein